MIDLDALEVAIAEGEKKNFFVAPIVKELIAEIRDLRMIRCIDDERIAAVIDQCRRDERAAVVAYLRAHDGESYDFADDIEQGAHRKENS